MTAIKKMVEVFSEYNIVYTEAEIEEVVVKVRKKSIGKMSTKAYQELFLINHGLFNNRHPFSDWANFIQQIKVESKWQDFPSWATNHLQMKYDSKFKRLCIDTDKVSFYAKLMADQGNMDLSFFEKQLSLRMGDEYKLKKLFESDKTASLLRIEIDRQLALMEEDFFENPKMIELTESIKNAAEEIFFGG